MLPIKSQWFEIIFHKSNNESQEEIPLIMCHPFSNNVMVYRKVP